MTRISTARNVQQEASCIPKRHREHRCITALSALKVHLESLFKESQLKMFACSYSQQLCEFSYLLAGTQFNQKAGFRACSCQENHYRKDRFGECFRCPPYGAVCQNETITLQAGFYWTWNNPYTNKSAYQSLTKNLIIRNDSYGKSSMVYTDLLPKPLYCPYPPACLGGMDSLCEEGYEGPLCAVCSHGYVKLENECKRCPSKWVIIVSMSTIILFLVLAVTIYVCKLCKNDSVVSDRLAARLKIILSFYQVLSGACAAFYYIAWPEVIKKVFSVLNVFQFDFFEIASPKCINENLNVDSIRNFQAAIITNVTALLITLMYYVIRNIYFIIVEKREQKRQQLLSHIRISCYRGLFFFLFLTYPSTSNKILRILPVACRDVCDEEEQFCRWYLRSDFSVECFTESHNVNVMFAYVVCVIYILGLPILTMVIIWFGMAKHLPKNMAPFRRVSQASKRVLASFKKGRPRQSTDKQETGKFFFLFFVILQCTLLQLTI